MINLSSDTSTQPSPEMLKVMAKAEVGDEQVKQDPTVLRLCETVADLLGKEDAIFLPTGTMCNLISFLVHCRPGDEIIAAKNAHIYRSEGVGASALAGACFAPIDTPSGIFDTQAVLSHIRAARPGKSPRSRVIAIEQTTNFGGGDVWQPSQLAHIGKVAAENRMKVHMDGARLLNAVVYSGLPAHAHTLVCDSSWLDLSKGLGCPFGAVLAGSKDFIEEAWEWKFRLGGAMRQAGYMAAGGLYALEHNFDRLHEDHNHARQLYDGIANIPGINVATMPPKTNILIFNVDNAHQFQQLLLKEGVKVGVAATNKIRMVTHLNFTSQQIAPVLQAIQKIMQHN